MNELHFFLFLFMVVIFSNSCLFSEYLKHHHFFTLFHRAPKSLTSSFYNTEYLNIMSPISRTKKMIRLSFFLKH